MRAPSCLGVGLSALAWGAAGRQGPRLLPQLEAVGQAEQGLNGLASLSPEQRARSGLSRVHIRMCALAWISAIWPPLRPQDGMPEATGGAQARHLHQARGRGLLRPVHGRAAEQDRRGVQRPGRPGRGAQLPARVCGACGCWQGLRREADAAVRSSTQCSASLCSTLGRGSYPLCASRCPPPPTRARVCHGACADASSCAQLLVVQSRLFDVGSAVATPLTSASEAKRSRTHFDDAETARLEAWIDEMDAELPPLTAFILPSGMCNRI